MFPTREREGGREGGRGGREGGREGRERVRDREKTWDAGTHTSLWWQ